MLVSNASASADVARTDAGAESLDDTPPEGVPDALWRPLQGH